MPIMDWVRGVWTSQDLRPVPEFKDAVFAKNKPKTGSIKSGTEDQTMVSQRWWSYPAMPIALLVYGSGSDNP
jgi:hypothetical protein